MKLLRVVVRSALFGAYFVTLIPVSLALYAVGPETCRRIGPRLLRIYSRVGLRILGYRGEVRGTVGTACDSSVLILSNHSSIVDILVLSDVFGSLFVSKQEVGGYPLIGSFARRIGVRFLDRDSMSARTGLIKSLARSETDGRIVIFPQGTTSCSRNPLPFSRGLFKAVELNPGIMIQPVTLVYEDTDTLHWRHGQSMLRHFLDVASLKEVRAKVIVHPVMTGFEGRRASEIHRVVEDTVLGPFRDKH